jgi:hypothetical protein
MQDVVLLQPLTKDQFQAERLRGTGREMVRLKDGSSSGRRTAVDRAIVQALKPFPQGSRSGRWNED